MWCAPGTELFPEAFALYHTERQFLRAYYPLLDAWLDHLAKTGTAPRRHGLTYFGFAFGQCDSQMRRVAISTFTLVRRDGAWLGWCVRLRDGDDK